MKTILKISLFLFLPFIAKAQQSTHDNLQDILQNATTDSARYNASYNLYLYFIEANRDSALFYVEKRLALAIKNKIKLAEAAALISRAYQYNAMGRYSEAFQNLLQALKIAEDPKNDEVQGWKLTQYSIPGKNRLIVLSTIHHVLDGLMRNAENPEQEILQLKEALKIAVQINHPDRQMTSNMNLARAYLKMNQLDSAFYFAKAAQVLSENPLAQGYIGNNLLTIGDISVIPQDIGRVLLNLINNAFYAANEKQKTKDEKFEPCVSIQTKLLINKVEIKVTDNGNGIPKNIVDKIFQPFFTSKPTGQGTGLGLSLTYDIIKAHKGEIKVETKEGEGTEFIIHLQNYSTQ
jgi:tetratricopeptide (TPR) repeat protein